MYKLCIVIVMCCALFPLGSAAPKTLFADTSRLESNAERNDGLQEELDGQESILSKVGENIHFFFFFFTELFLWILYCFVRRNSNLSD